MEHALSIVWLAVGVGLCALHVYVRQLYVKTGEKAARAIMLREIPKTEGVGAMLAARRTVVRQTWFLLMAVGNTLLGVGGLLTPVAPARSDVPPLALFLAYAFVGWVGFMQLTLGGLTLHDLWYRARIFAVNAS